MTAATHGRRAARRVLLMAASAGVLGSCGDSPTSIFSDARGVILFVSGERGGREIYAMRPDGTERVRLTWNDVADHSPDLSPDGREIVLASHQDSTPGHPGRHADIFVMRADGSGVRRLTDFTWNATHPRWSPDGRRIVFERYDPDARLFRVYVMSRNGSDQRPLTPTLHENFSPEWSPDGTRILFLSNRAPRFWWTMYVMQPDGTGEQQLAGDEACLSNVTDPRFSPDGSRIAYRCDSSFGPGIYVMNADGTAPVRLAGSGGGDDLGSAFGPIWSPDGRTLAFTRGVSGGYEIFSMDAAGGPATALTSDGGVNVAASWGRAR